MHDGIEEVIDQLFDRLAALFPAFKQAWPTQQEVDLAKIEWLKGFAESGINTISRVNKGINKMRQEGSPFIPSCGQFIGFCKLEPEDVAAPSMETAFREACKHANPSYWADEKWSHGAVKWAARKTGNDTLMGNPTKARELFEKNYLDACQMYKEGKIMDSLPVNTQKTWYEYQIFHSIMKSDMQLGFIPKDTKIPSFQEWSNGEVINVPEELNFSRPDVFEEKPKDKYSQSYKNAMTSISELLARAKVCGVRKKEGL